MTRLEWLSILMLLSLICFFSFEFNTRTLTSAIPTAFLVTAGLILVLVLKQLDNLRWQEEQWIWQPLHNLFTSLGLIPYYPDDVLKESRVTIAGGQKIRIAHYINPYPDMRGKEVREVIVPLSLTELKKKQP